MSESDADEESESDADEESDDDYEEADIVDKHNRYRFNCLFYYCRKCGMSYKAERDVLKHCNVCTAHGESFHVVYMACRSIEHLITKKRVVVTTHAEKNPKLQGIVVSGVTR